MPPVIGNGGQAGNPGKSADRAGRRRQRLAGHPGFRRHRDSPGGAGLDRRSRLCPARRTRPGQDPAAARTRGSAGRVDAGDRRRRTGRAPLHADHAGVDPAGRAARRRPTGGVEAPQRALHREAGHPDTSVADLVGDVDPIKVAEGRSLGIPKPSPTGSSRGRTAASSRSTSCPTSPNASRCRCSTSWRSATSRSAATRCGCRWMCWWSPAPTPRTTPTVAASSRPSRTGSAPRSAPTTHWSWRRRWASSSRRRT